MAYDKAKLFALIASCSDTGKLRNWIDNARRKGVKEVEDAAINRLIEVEALKNHDNPDELELDFWKSIIALEFVLSQERGKTTRLSRTRQKIARVGIRKTLADLALSAEPSEGYFLLRDRGMLEMSAEAVVLRHPEQFDAETIAAAQKRRG